eukprot:9409261-Alexandrium_andersonii.AAC.1
MPPPPALPVQEGVAGLNGGSAAHMLLVAVGLGALAKYHMELAQSSPALQRQFLLFLGGQSACEPDRAGKNRRSLGRSPCQFRETVSHRCRRRLRPRWLRWREAPNEDRRRPLRA